MPMGTVNRAAVPSLPRHIVSGVSCSTSATPSNVSRSPEPPPSPGASGRWWRVNARASSTACPGLKESGTPMVSTPASVCTSSPAPAVTASPSVSARWARAVAGREPTSTTTAHASSSMKSSVPVVTWSTTSNTG